MAIMHLRPTENGVSRFRDSPLAVNVSQPVHIENAVNGDTKAVPVDDITAFTPRKKLRIITVGAGFSGLLLAHKLQHQNPDMQDLVSHTIFEARHEIGGTWLVNRYPGVQCDVASHVYAFPFDPNPDWSHFYSSAEEIHEYILRTTKKWNLDRDIQLNHRVTEACWQEDVGQWKVTVEHEGIERVEHADILISGQGVLNSWHWPDIDGFHDFKGQKCHSASWDHDYDYSHKRIAIIGNGSSGIQIVPRMAELPGTEVTSFQRSPNWIYYRIPPSKLLGRDDVGGNPAYTEEDKRRFREDPAEHKRYRKVLIHRINTAFRMFVKDSSANLEVTQIAAKQMAERLNHDPELCAKLIPKWPLGCRRITPGEGYLESFLRPNVGLTMSPITKFSENAVHTADGKRHEVDVVVCATGFDVSLRPQWRMIGRNNVNLGKKWSEKPESYMSVAAADMPNYFMFNGPNAVIAHGSLMESMNWTADYMMKWIRKIATEDIKSIVPKAEAVNEFILQGDKIHDRLIWTGGCKSWFKRNTVDGRVVAIFPGTSFLYKRLISQIRAEDFEIRYRSANRWWFMQNGFTDYELDHSNDLAWYIEK